ncbi:MAG TPA: alpha-glucan family phosphorylase [Candidatus Limnocylindrales bacterium]|nr:alpha-glucan family phosphorylase [Candidatus Limnocylindrales bacterium]
MEDLKKWFEDFRGSEHMDFFKKKPIAYFSVEYALSDLLPTYAGGLGVLAGDYVRELGDQKIPAVALGLFYQNKYGSLDAPHKQPNSILLTPEEQGLKPVVDKNQNPILIQVPIEDHDVFVKAWVWQNDSIPVYLLDTDVEENSHVDRQIVYQLYDADKETRLKQEMILGIGGFRLLEKMNIQPSIYHMNEGHSAMLYLEIIRHEMNKRKIGFKEAMILSTHHVVFTNHTLVASGNEIFSNELFTFLLSRYATELEVPLYDILALGNIQDSSSFSMSLMSLRLAGRINAVSALHAMEAAKSWSEYKFEYVTNGIHLPSWDKTEGMDLISSHKQNKKVLLEHINKQTGNEWGENDLIIGWARRMVRYKRPMSILGDIQRLKSLITPEKPIRIVMGGIAHQSDDDGRDMLNQIKKIMEKELPGTAVYLNDYSVTLARIMNTGCDIWLNTPVIGSEACGTSGMKASLNGTLTMSTKDGWIYEVNTKEIGWDIDSGSVEKSILDVLQHDVLPVYYGADKSQWESLMKNGRNLILEKFSATRMLKEYIEKLYLPVVTSSYSHYSS